MLPSGPEATSKASFWFAVKDMLAVLAGLSGVLLLAICLPIFLVLFGLFLVLGLIATAVGARRPVPLARLGQLGSRVFHPGLPGFADECDPVPVTLPVAPALPAPETAAS